MNSSFLNFFYHFSILNYKKVKWAAIQVTLPPKHCLTTFKSFFFCYLHLFIFYETEILYLYALLEKICFLLLESGRVAQSVGHLTRKSGVLGSIPGLATYFRFSFRFFKKGSCQLLAKVCARSTG